MTEKGALINPSASSTTIVTHKQHGHMQVNANLQSSHTPKKKNQFS